MENILDQDGSVVNDSETEGKQKVVEGHAPFLETGQMIGRTASTRFEPNTSSKFHFWISAGSDAEKSIEIGNIVAAHADDGNDVTFGVVVEMRSYSDVEGFIADFLSHDFGDASIEVPTDVPEVIVVTCDVMRNLSSKAKPVGRSHVYFPSVLGIQFAYGMKDKKGENVFRDAAIPVGFFENGDGTKAPVSVDENFLIGPEGAHMNVSGISGQAAKTSAVEFVTKSLLTHKSPDKSVAVVMFNVKSQDLLYIDQPNPELDDNEKSRDAYEKLGIPMEPFREARFFAPADERNPGKTRSKRVLNDESFKWNLPMLKENIPSLFDSEDWDDKMIGVWDALERKIDRGDLLTYASMMRWIENTLDKAKAQNWNSIEQQHPATWRKMLSRLRGFQRTYRGLISKGSEGNDILWDELSDKSVYVIDIAELADRGKRLVFGRAIDEIQDLLEREDRLDAVVVFVDELNKFGPSGSFRSPLKRKLVNITARGRSIGLVLFGAEQFASSVDKEIVENSSTYLFGRTKQNELRTPNYSAFSDEIKNKLATLEQGTLLVDFAKFPQPIFTKFPYPPCCPGNEFEPANDQQQSDPISEDSFIGSLADYQTTNDEARNDLS